MKCKNCGEEISNGSNFCEYCGTKVSNKRKNHIILWLCFAAVFVAIAVVAFVHLNPNGEDEKNDKNRVINVIEEFNNAYASNDFATLSAVYANNVERFHNAYNLSNSEVVEKYKNYDTKFGVYEKHISVRWNTLQVENLPDDELSVVFVEDYSIERVDKSKKSIYVLEEHLILDSDYKIKSIYDVHL